MNLQILHDYLAKGALAKGWGGVECYQSIPLQVHLIESSTWLFISLLFFQTMQGGDWLARLTSEINTALVEYKKSVRSFNYFRFVELFFGCLHVLMFVQIIYYKWNIQALIYLLQPCHVILLVQGIALLSEGSLGVLISLFVLPALTGTLLAMLFPETTGLDQPLEVESYWLQHYLIQFVPFYLLLRRNALALRFASKQTVVAGLWILTVLHFFLLEIVDVSFMVNVDFILCPTSAMVDIFGLFPKWLFLPSYRTFMTIAVFLVGALISYTYISVATFYRNTFLGSSSTSSKKVV